MTPAEINRVIAEHDAAYPRRPNVEDPHDKRVREKAEEQKQRQLQEAKKTEDQALIQTQWYDWFIASFKIALLDKKRIALLEAIGMSLGDTCQKLRKEYKPRIDALETRLKDLEQQRSLEAKFFEMERRLDQRQQDRDQAKRGHEGEQGELLGKFEVLQRQVDDLKRVADLGAPFCDLAERVGAIEQTSSLEARFSKFADEVKRDSAIPRDESLAKFEALQRQVDDLKRVADPDVRFRELTERVSELEKTTSLEARFAKLAHEVKRGSELPQSELLSRIVELERRLDDFKRIANQPGTQGPPGTGKLPIAKEYVAGRVHYESDVVTHVGALWQAQCDTVHSPPHDDWTLLARPGRDATMPTVCGTYDTCGKYKKLDIVVSDGAAFIAKRDNPGICPGDGWQIDESAGQARSQGRRWCARSAWRKGRERRAWHNDPFMAARSSTLSHQPAHVRWNGGSDDGVASNVRAISKRN
jgi:hypothetical protein